MMEREFRIDGKLTYRGIDVADIIHGCAADNRFGFEEVIWLLIFGTQPTKKQLEDFTDIISSYRELPEYLARGHDYQSSVCKYYE